MLKKRVRKVLVLVLFLSIFPLFKAKGDGAYLHDSSTSYVNSHWMKEIPDATPINRISMVGTHDTAGFYGGDIPQTQTLSISDQLKMGVRFLDIRCRHFRNELLIYHGIVYEHMNFRDVIDEVSEFLRENPSETVLMRLSASGTVPYGNSNTFEDSFLQVHNEFSSLNPQLFWRPSGFSLPTLGEARGKIIILQQFSSRSPYGWSYHHADNDIQDEYTMNTNWDLYSKWEAIKNHINKAMASGGSRGLFMNYLSASRGSFPYFVVSGKSSPQMGAPRLMTGLTTPGWKNTYPDFPRVNCFIGICSIAFEGTNILTAQYLAEIRQKEISRKPYVGIIVTDFPGPALIEAVVQLN